MKALILGFFMLVVFSLSGCFNLFTGMTPSDPSSISDTNALFSLADREMDSPNLPGNYQRAFTAYQRVLEIAPGSVRAVKGSCAAYTAMRIPVSNLFQAISDRDLSGIPGGYSNLAAVSLYVGSNLDRVLWSGTNFLPRDDQNMYLNYYLFQTLSSFLAFADLDKDSEFLSDPDDLFTFTGYRLSPLSYTNHPGALASNFAASLPRISTLPALSIGLAQSLKKAAIVLNQLLSNTREPITKASLSNFAAGISSLRTESDQTMALLGLDGISLTNLAFSNLAILSGYPYSGPSNAPAVLTNLLAASSVTNISSMASGFGNLGPYTSVTNATNAAQITSVLTNMFPDLISAAGNLEAALSNYFQ